jgi:hypothetical protein
MRGMWDAVPDLSICRLQFQVLEVVSGDWQEIEMVLSWTRPMKVPEKHQVAQAEAVVLVRHWPPKSWTRSVPPVGAQAPAARRAVSRVQVPRVPQS